MRLLTWMIALMCFCLAPLAHAEININTATAQQLTELNNIGPVKAAAIVDYRTQHGYFKEADDLLKVQGIGADTLEQNRELLTVELEPAMALPERSRAVGDNAKAVTPASAAHSESDGESAMR